MRRIWIVAPLAGAALLMAASSQAATYTANGGGATGNSSIIDAGGGGDYLSLAAAAADFNSGPAVAGDYTFFIASNLTEPANVGFYKDTGATAIITIKPAATTNPIVEFTATADNTGPTGHLVIGGNPGVFDQGVATHRFVIDGSNTPSGTTRNLTIRNTAADVLGTSRVVHVWGDSDNVVVKNLIVQNLDTTAAAIGIGVSTAVVTSVNYVPGNVTFQNNEVRVESAVNGNGILCGRVIVSGTGQTGVSNTQQGNLITGNDVFASGQGIVVDAASNVTVSDNTIEIDQATQTGFWAAGIAFGTGSNQATGAGETGSGPFTNTISGNEIRKLRTGATVASVGVSGIRLEGGISNNAGNVWNIYNNIITGFDTTTASANSMRYSGVSSTVTLASSINFMHNSVNLPTSLYTGLVTNRAMGFGHAAGTAPAVVRNNIFRIGHPQGVAIHHVTPALTSEGNTLFHAGPTSGGYGRDGANVRATFAAWQGAGFDAAVGGGSNDADALGTTNFTWNSATDLRFNSAALPAINFPDLIASPVAINTDIDGNSRPASSTPSGKAWPGAHEESIPSSVGDWSVLN